MTSWIYSTEDLAVTGKEDIATIEILVGRKWRSVDLERNIARNLAAHILAWCARDSDGTAIAAVCGDIPVPQDCQARAESIAPNTPPNHPRST